jgi:serine/threonine-protein kinase HipA
MAKELNVWMNGELVGTWAHPRGGSHRFTYEQSWLGSARSRPLSLSIPITAGAREVRGPVVENYFDNLLPDNEAIRKRLQSRFHTGSIQAFELLSAIGRDCVGAVQLLPPDSQPVGFDTISAEPLSSEAIEKHLRDVAVPGGLGGADQGDFRISIAGAQEKTAFLRHKGKWCKPQGMTPTTHIFKLPLGLIAGGQLDLRDSVENEWLCMQFLRAMQLPTPRVDIATFGAQKALIVERFDRMRVDKEGGGQWIARLPQEDFCQATGTPPSQKYESDGGPGISACLSLLSSSTVAETDKMLFACVQLTFWLLAAPDGHAKNFSIFLLPGNAFEMTAFYDVLSAWPVIGKGAGKRPYQAAKLAMGLKGKSMHRSMREIQPRHWRALAAQTGNAATWQYMLQIVDDAPDEIDKLLNHLPAGFPEHVARSIGEGIKKQCRFFNAVLENEKADKVA